MLIVYTYVPYCSIVVYDCMCVCAHAGVTCVFYLCRTCNRFKINLISSYIILHVYDKLDMYTNCEPHHLPKTRNKGNNIYAAKQRCAQRRRKMKIRTDMHRNYSSITIKSIFETKMKPSELWLNLELSRRRNLHIYRNYFIKCCYPRSGSVEMASVCFKLVCFYSKTLQVLL